MVRLAKDCKEEPWQRGDGVEEANTDGKPVLRSFMRYPLSELETMV